SARGGAPPPAPGRERRRAPQHAERRAEVTRPPARGPPAVSLTHVARRSPPVSQFLERFRALLQRRSRFDFDAELDGLSRSEQAVAFLALLELRRADEITISQAAPFAPIRVARVGEERPATDARDIAGNVRSA